MDQIMSVHDAWRFLENHPIFRDKGGISRFKSCLDIDVVEINPLTGEIDEDPRLNTGIQVWLECGAWESDLGFGVPSHDIDLDCGAPTFEEALIELAKLVKTKYGK